MDIEFIEEEHRDNIFKIMELCDCEMAQAYELYNNNGCNVENAVQAKFNSFDNNVPVSNNYPQPSYASQSLGNNISFGFGVPHLNRQGSEEDEYENFKIFRQTGMTFNKKYEVRKENTGIAKGFFSFFRSDENTFKKTLQQYISKKTNLQLQNGSLTEAFQSVVKQKFPLIVHVLDFHKDPLIINNIKRVYADDFLVEMMSQQFKNYGVSTKTYDLQPCLKKFIDLKADANTLLIFRINVMDDIVLMAKIPLMSSSVEEIKKKFKQIKSNCIQIEMEEMHMQRRYYQELKGNFNYQKPMSIAEKRKLQEDREIRRKQEEEFFAAMQPKQQETKLTNTYSSPSKQMTQINTSSKPQVSPVKKDNKAEAKQQRQRIRKNLKIYETDGEGIIAIKLRLPSSELVKLYVHSSEPAQYLYDYVFSRVEDSGFEDDESKRIFDIIEPYEKLNLSERKQQQLGKIFEGQTMLTLVVNEKSE